MVKLKTLLTFTIILIAVMTLGCVSAADDNSTDVVSSDIDAAQDDSVLAADDDEPEEFEFDIYGESFTYGENNTLEIYSPKLNEKELTIEIDNDGNYSKKYNEADEFYGVDISNLGLGMHNVTVIYNGDNKYPASLLETTISIDAEIIAQDRVNYGEGCIYLNLPEDAKGTLNFYLSTEHMNSERADKLHSSVELVDGHAYIPISDLDVGEYYYFAVFNGDNYNVGKKSGNLIVHPNVIMPTEKTYGEAINIKIIGDEKSNGKFTFTYNDGTAKTSYTTNLVNGSGELTLNYLPIKHNPVKITYVGEDGLHWNATKYIDIKPITPVLSNNKNINMYYCDGSTYQVKVQGIYGKIVGAGEKVAFTIGSTVHNVKTDSRGIATLKLTELPGKYTIKAEYKGVSVKNTLKIKQILSLKNVNVKKSAKKLQLTATLKKVNGKYLKGKTITFKFNGKTYKSKTDKKGVAKVTVKKSVLNKLKVGKKLTYSATYIKDTVSKTVKVKK